MAKNFAPRVRKSERSTIDLTEKLSRDLFKISDDRLLKGARLEEVTLTEINVKEQVRTKFNESSLNELAENIRVNGLIQPLVVHRTGGILTLICGERRYRAMRSINKETAPCFILENKSEEELMAIQFSENSSREELHYIDKADGIYNYQISTKASERQIMKALGISKSEVHRSLLIAKVPNEIKACAKQFNIEKYVLLEWNEIVDEFVKKHIAEKIVRGEITKREQLKKFVTKERPAAKTKRTEGPMSSAEILKLVNDRTKELNMDSKTKAMLAKLVKETQQELS